jgi:uncharacterized membrane protein
VEVFLTARGDDGTTRLETFSDGVIAIIITIMLLEIEGRAARGCVQSAGAADRRVFDLRA